MRFLIIFAISAVYFPKLSTSSEISNRKLPCALSWKELSATGNIPLGSIVSSNENYIIRIFDEDANNYFSGFYNPHRKMSSVTIPNEDLVETIKRGNFEILTNPHGCNISWEEPRFNRFTNLYLPLSRFVVQVNKSSTESPRDYIGRVGRPWIAGHVKWDRRQPKIFSDGTVSSSKFQILNSFSTKGLTLRLENMTILNPEAFENATAKPGILGMDTIINDSECTVKKTIFHQKNVTQTNGISVDIALIPGVVGEIVAKAEICIFIICIKLEIGIELDLMVAGSINPSFERITVTEVNATQSITVPPRSTVLACSVYTSRHGIEVKYNATGVYEGIGMTADEILEEVKKDAPNAKICPDLRVCQDIIGDLIFNVFGRAKFAMSNHDDFENCVAVRPVKPTGELVLEQFHEEYDTVYF